MTTPAEYRESFERRGKANVIAFIEAGKSRGGVLDDGTLEAIRWLSEVEAKEYSEAAAKRDEREKETLSIAKEANRLASEANEIARSASFAATAAASAATDANDIARSNRRIAIAAAVIAVASAIAQIIWR